jgi:predicted nucleic acid-binding protein
MPHGRNSVPDAADVVVDASVVVDLVADTPSAPTVADLLAGRGLCAPAHVDAEVLSALGRMERAGKLTARRASRALAMGARVPIERSSLPELLDGAWRRRKSLRLSDALYVELAEQLGLELVTTDRRLARAYAGALLVDVSQ